MPHGICFLLGSSFPNHVFGNNNLLNLRGSFIQTEQRTSR